MSRVFSLAIGRRAPLAILALLVACAGQSVGGAAPPGEAARGGFAPPLFAFENGVRLPTHAEQAALLKRLGYDGIGSVSPRDLPQRLQACDAAGIKMLSIYVGAQVGPQGASYDPLIPQAIQQLKGRDAVVELTLRGKADDADEQAVQVVRQIADLAAESDLRVVLYPHYGFYVSSTADALRIVKRVERANVGLMFNLCHFLRSEEPADLERTIEEMAPRLMRVSICGADRDGQDWRTLIQPLDQGNFDQLRLLRLLRQHGFRGAIGLQCYNVPGDPQENLQRSITAWRKLLDQLPAETE